MMPLIMESESSTTLKEIMMKLSNGLRSAWRSIQNMKILSMDWEVPIIRKAAMNKLLNGITNAFN